MLLFNDSTDLYLILKHLKLIFIRYSHRGMNVKIARGFRFSRFRTRYLRIRSPAIPLATILNNYMFYTFRFETLCNGIATVDFGIVFRFIG